MLELDVLIIVLAAAACYAIMSGPDWDRSVDVFSNIFWILATFIFFSGAFIYRSIRHPEATVSLSHSIGLWGFWLTLFMVVAIPHLLVVGIIAFVVGRSNDQPMVRRAFQVLVAWTAMIAGSAAFSETVNPGAGRALGEVRTLIFGPDIATLNIDEQTRSLILSGGAHSKQLQQLIIQGQSMRRQIDREIPAYRKLLLEQAGQVRHLVGGPVSAEGRSQLDRELREIARLLVTLDQYEQQCSTTMVRIDSSIRGLTRVLSSHQLLGPEAEEILAQAAEAEVTASSLLETKMAGLGASSQIDQAAVERKLQALRQGH